MKIIYGLYVSEDPLIKDSKERADDAAKRICSIESKICVKYKGNWQLGHIYSDLSINGISNRNIREQAINDAINGKIQVIVTDDLLNFFDSANEMNEFVFGIFLKYNVRLLDLTHNIDTVNCICKCHLYLNLYQRILPSTTQRRYELKRLKQYQKLWRNAYDT